MKYQLLGPLRVVDGDTATPVSAPKMGCVLTALLIRSNQVVSKDALISEIWGEEPPRRATPALHVYISQLRKLLSASQPAAGPIVTRSPGYLLQVEEGQIDWQEFRSLAERAREYRRGGALVEAVHCFEQALKMWRGAPPSELGEGPIVTGFLTWLQEFRLECLEEYVEVNLELGTHRAVVSLLFNLVAEYPLHETFYGQLMRALHASERRADALRVYRQARQVLDEELGLEPGPTLRRLHNTVLTADAPLPARMAG
jgi:DNA-binding SARP family transcriptional activator